MVVQIPSTSKQWNPINIRRKKFLLLNFLTEKKITTASVELRTIYLHTHLCSAIFLKDVTLCFVSNVNIVHYKAIQWALTLGFLSEVRISLGGLQCNEKEGDCKGKGKKKNRWECMTFLVEYFSGQFTTSYHFCMHLFIWLHIILFVSPPSKVLLGMKRFQWDPTVIWIWPTSFIFQEAQMLIWSTLDVVHRLHSLLWSWLKLSTDSAGVCQDESSLLSGKVAAVYKSWKAWSGYIKH